MILVELFPPDELLKFAIFMWSLIIGSAFGFLFLLSNTSTTFLSVISDSRSKRKTRSRT